MICKDELNHLYKICECRQALICPECFELCKNTLVKCPLCRKNLKYIKIRNWSKYCKLIFLYLSSYLFMLCLNLIYPIICINNENTLENKLFFSLTFLAHIFIEPINLYLIKKYIDLSYFYYYLLKSMCVSIITCVLFIIETKSHYLNYIIGVIIPFYVLPLIIGSLFINYNFLKKNLKYTNYKTLVKIIKFDVVQYIQDESIV